jgi:hypothetical protein
LTVPEIVPVTVCPIAWAAKRIISTLSKAQNMALDLKLVITLTSFLFANSHPPTLDLSPHRGRGRNLAKTPPRGPLRMTGAFPTTVPDE